MSREPSLFDAAVQAARAALLRAALGRLARRAGSFRGLPLRRLAWAAGRPPRPGVPRALGPATTLTHLVPSITSLLSRLGLGLAGGGGGSPGRTAGA